MITTYPKNASELKVLVFATVMNEVNTFTTENTDKIIASVDAIYEALGGDDYGKNKKVKDETQL